MSYRMFRTVLVLVLCAAVRLHADDVDQGIDLWKTLPGTAATKAHLQIPAGFFNLGSDAVDATLEFKGQALETKPGTPSLGNADTVLERLAPAHPQTCGASDKVALQMVALHLVAEPPLTVRYGGSSPEGWTVDVYLSDAAQAPGTITIYQSCADGGTFQSSFTVRPKLIFTRTSDGLTRILDWKVYPQAAKEIHFAAEGRWARRGPDDFGLTTAQAGAVVDANHDGVWEVQSPLPGTTSDFVVGAAARSCSCAQAARLTRAAVAVDPVGVKEEEAFASHGVDPPTFLRASFPLHRDAPAGPADESPSAAVWFLRFAPLGLLALAAVAGIPWKKPRT